MLAQANLFENAIEEYADNFLKKQQKTAGNGNSSLDLDCWLYENIPQALRKDVRIAIGKRLPIVYASNGTQTF